MVPVSFPWKLIIASFCSFPNFVMCLSVIHIVSPKVWIYLNILTQVINGIHIFLGDYPSRDFCSNVLGISSVLLFPYISFPELSSSFFQHDWCFLRSAGELLSSNLDPTHHTRNAPLWWVSWISYLLLSWCPPLLWWVTHSNSSLVF